MRIGVDVGGTKIEGVLLDRQGRELARKRVPTPKGNYAATLDTISTLVAWLQKHGGAAATVGVGIPGAISPASGLVKNANSTWLIGRPFLDDLRTRLGPRVRVANDANCFALSEAVDGAGAGAAVVFGVILGTGTGGGIVVDGKVVEGRHAVGGEWGHTPLPWPETGEWPGSSCYCGRTGCIETFLSGPGLADDYGRAVGEICSPEDIVVKAGAGDQPAEDALARYEHRLARALAGLINVLDPDVIVLGGGMSNVDRLYSAVPRQWAPYVFSDVVATPLVKARHGDAGGVRGAAWLWPDASSRL